MTSIIPSKTAGSKMNVLSKQDLKNEIETQKKLIKILLQQIEDCHNRIEKLNTQDVLNKLT